MAMQHCIGVSAVAREIIEPYQGVSAVARKISEEYIGVSGVARQYFSGMPAKGKALNSYTWAEISKISKAGLASSYWSVGDTKSISFNGTTYLVQIIGFDHDTPTSVSTYGRSKAGITFQFGKENDANYDGVVKEDGETYGMNDTNTNSGGWKSSKMRTTYMPKMRNYLPSDLKNVLVAVNKLTSAGSKSSTINTTSDELFLLSEVEVCGSYSEWSVSGEGSQYAYYSSFKSSVRYSNGNTVEWWFRSPYDSTARDFVFTYGGTNNGWDTDCASANSVFPFISFAFCV